MTEESYGAPRLEFLFSSLPVRVMLKGEDNTVAAENGPGKQKAFLSLNLQIVIIFIALIKSDLADSTVFCAFVVVINFA